MLSWYSNFLAIDSDKDIKMSSFHQSRKPHPVRH